MAIDINKLTIGEVKQIVKEFMGLQQPKKEVVEVEPAFRPSPKNPAVGKYCIVRCQKAGVHAGIVKQANSDFVELSDSRRLWQWKSGFTLSEAAKEGIQTDSKIATTIDTLIIPMSDVGELIPTTDKARKTIEGAKEYHA